MLLFIIIIKTVKSWRSASAENAYKMGFLRNTHTHKRTHAHTHTHKRSNTVLVSNQEQGSLGLESIQPSPPLGRFCQIACLPPLQKCLLYEDIPIWGGALQKIEVSLIMQSAGPQRTVPPLSAVTTLQNIPEISLMHHRAWNRCRVGFANLVY